MQATRPLNLTQSEVNRVALSHECAGEGCGVDRRCWPVGLTGAVVVNEQRIATALLPHDGGQGDGVNSWSAVLQDVGQEGEHDGSTEAGHEQYLLPVKSDEFNACFTEFKIVDRFASG